MVRAQEPAANSQGLRHERLRLCQPALLAIQDGHIVRQFRGQVVLLTKEGPEPVCIRLLGSIPVDPSVSRAINQQQLLVKTAPEAPATCGISSLAESIAFSPAWLSAVAEQAEQNP